MKTSAKKLVLLLLLISLSACARQYQELNPVALTPEMEAKFQENLASASAQLKKASAEGTKAPADVYLVLSRAQQRLGYLKEAEKVYLEALELYPRDPVIRRNAGLFYESIGFYKKAEEHLRFAVRELNATLEEKDLARVYLALENKQEGMNAYRRWRSKTGNQDEDLLRRLKALE